MLYSHTIQHQCFYGWVRIHYHHHRTPRQDLVTRQNLETIEIGRMSDRCCSVYYSRIWIVVCDGGDHLVCCNRSAALPVFVAAADDGGPLYFYFCYCLDDSADCFVDCLRRHLAAAPLYCVLLYCELSTRIQSAKCVPHTDPEFISWKTKTPG